MNDQHHPTVVCIHLDRLTHNIRLLQSLVGERPIWPAIKANAYGHGLEMVARHLRGLGYRTLCVAHVNEAAALLEAGIDARILVLSASLPEQAEAIVAYDCELAVCSSEMVAAAGQAAESAANVVPRLAASPWTRAWWTSPRYEAGSGWVTR